jgi:hypothetical protein
MLFNGCKQSLGEASEITFSPSGRFYAHLWRCCDVYPYISAFDIFDRRNIQLHRMELRTVEGLPESAGGTFFEWTPSEEFLVIVTDNRVTSHGCSELLVYKGDGSALIYNSAYSSVCRLHPTADQEITILELCNNDDVLFLQQGRTYVLSPSSGTVIRAAGTTCI